MVDSVISLIEKWNESRLDLFAISQPNPENGEFHGVIRFYHKDQGEKVATKCIRVSSSATTQDVIETLREKFRSDMRMLSQPVYSLYVTYPTGDYRKLENSECPLMAQLNWANDNSDGRFLVQNEGDKYSIAKMRADIYGIEDEDNGFKAKSKKKKEKKKINKNKPDIAAELYNEVLLNLGELFCLNFLLSKIFFVQTFYCPDFFRQTIFRLNNNHLLKFQLLRNVVGTGV